MSGPEDEISQAEKRSLLRQDADVRRQQEQAAKREQSGTFFSHTHADEISGGGRFAGVNPATVVGSEPAVRYPAAAAHQADPCGTEPPLGYRVDAMSEQESSTVSSSFPVEETGDPVSDALRRDKTASAESAGADSAAGSPSLSKLTND
jgi:hypothetical protein